MDHQRGDLSPNPYAGIPDETLTLEEYRAREGGLDRPLTDTIVGYKGRYRDVGTQPEGVIHQELAVQANHRRPE